MDDLQEKEDRIVKMINSLPNFHDTGPNDGDHFEIDHWTVYIDSNEALRKGDHRCINVGENNLVESLKELYGDGRVWYGDVVLWCDHVNIHVCFMALKEITE